MAHKGRDREVMSNMGKEMQKYAKEIKEKNPGLDWKKQVMPMAGEMYRKAHGLPPKKKNKNIVNGKLKYGKGKT